MLTHDHAVIWRIKENGLKGFLSFHNSCECTLCFISKHFTLIH
ncbi:hypothetical protein CGLO_11773 [Colletotrichum gloeosporioides Cg-14]|uniref:Uncharacterized protein n=1 Tax=Colletotrichum gloeosporioides (strain Cg-14) TaxID=1237896 RepID=T0K7K5_COLGC|nr:hypothetical protein CGLO_11773 [Colletotrichum gloeosporioides Cg-14]